MSCIYYLDIIEFLIAIILIFKNFKLSFISILNILDLYLVINKVNNSGIFWIMVSFEYECD